MKHGVVNFLKPPGMTSSDAVVALRRLFQEKRVGHTGTLDPGAAGVLPICIGRATRLFDYLVDKDKDYLAEIAFGAATDTQDAYGSILEQRPTSVTKAALAKALPGFLGPQEQIAPMYSALKSGGKKLYELADVVLDNCAPAAEAMMEVEGIEARLCAASGLSAAFILWSVTTVVVEELMKKGKTPGVLKSANFPGGNDYNKSYIEPRYEKEGL